MVSLHKLSTLICAFSAMQFSAVTADVMEVGASMPISPARGLRAQHNGESHQGAAASPGGGNANPSGGATNPGGILGPLYAAFPQLLAPLAMVSDTVHNSNAAISGVQHTPEGIFQA